MDIRKWAIMAGCLGAIISIGLFQPEIKQFLSHAKGNSMSEPHLHVWAPTPADTAAVELYAIIRQEAEKRYVAPVDAYVDRVWKAIPGYNGLEVDVEATYEQALARPKGAPITYITREVPPQVQLQDLPLQPIYRGNPSKPAAGLMINVAWGNEYIQPMLDTLKAEQVHATFFLDGSWLKGNADLAKQIVSAGHEIGNHAYSHPDMAKLARGAAAEQVSRTEALIKDKLGLSSTWFAPPSGSFNQGTVEVAWSSGMRTVLWTVDTIDWKKPAPDTIIRKIADKVEAGSLILMHPTSSSSQALAEMIKAIKQKGLFPGTVSSTLSPDRLPAVE